MLGKEGGSEGGGGAPEVEGEGWNAKPVMGLDIGFDMKNGTFAQLLLPLCS